MMLIRIYLLCLPFFFCFITSSFADNDKKLNILFMVDKFPYSPRRYINNQIISLIDQGHNVNILTQRLMTRDIINFPEIAEYKLLEKTFYGELPEDQRTYDIIYCQFGSEGLRAIQLKQNVGLQGKIVVCFRGGDASTYMSGSNIKFIPVFQEADMIFVVCENFRKRLIQCGCPSDKVIVHHSGINCDKFVYKKRKHRPNRLIKILTVARFTQMKGYEYALEAIDILRKKYPNIIYQIVGVGSMQRKLEKIVQERNLSKHVIFKGFLDIDDVVNILHKSHIFLLASYTPPWGEQEGIPNAIMEALSTGLPVVATRHSGIREIIQEGKSGLLANEKDAKGLAKKLAYLIENPNLWNDFGRVGREYVLKEHNTHLLNKILVDRFNLILQKDQPNNSIDNHIL